VNQEENNNQQAQDNQQQRDKNVLQLQNVPNDYISQRAAFWFSFIKAVGWPGAILIALCYGTHVTVQKLLVVGEPLAARLVDTHITTISGLLEQSRKTTEILKELVDYRKEDSARLSEVHRAVVPSRESSRESK
jgi:hypothetical protein